MRAISLSLLRAFVPVLAGLVAGGCGLDQGDVLRQLERIRHHGDHPPPAPVLALQLSGTDDVPGQNDDFVVRSPIESATRPFATLTVSLAGAGAYPGWVALTAEGGGQVTLDPARVAVTPSRSALVRVFGDRASGAVDDVVIRAQLEGSDAQATEDLTVIDGVSLSFEGNFQDRLATDPDPSNDPRGHDGSTRALEGESDLDGIIRFSSPGDLRLACTFEPVRVTRVHAEQPDGIELVGDAIIGQVLDLGPMSKFVDPDGNLQRERIDGFELHLGALDARGEFPIGSQVGFRFDPGLDPILADYRGREALLVAERAMRPADDIEVRRIDARLLLREQFRYDTWQLRFTRPFCGNARDTGPATPPQGSQLLELLRGDAGLDYRIDFFGFDADCLRGRISGTLRPTTAGAPPLCTPGSAPPELGSDRSRPPSWTYMGGR
jgi:hypothetical protein